MFTMAPYEPVEYESLHVIYSIEPKYSVSCLGQCAVQLLASHEHASTPRNIWVKFHIIPEMTSKLKSAVISKIKHHCKSWGQVQFNYILNLGFLYEISAKHSTSIYRVYKSHCIIYNFLKHLFSKDNTRHHPILFTSMRQTHQMHVSKTQV